jgi:hypothetical protein
MARMQTVVKVMEIVLDDDGNMLNAQGEIIDPSRKTKKIQEPVYEEVMYYLLHWGLTYEILVDGQQRYPIAYTVAICQHIKNGTIKSFTPQDLTVVGKEEKR